LLGHAGCEGDRGIIITVLNLWPRRDRGVCAGRGSDWGKAVVSLTLTSLRSVTFWHLPTREETLTGNEETRIRIRYLAWRVAGSKRMSLERENRRYETTE
jgi:hypothetical protein